MGESAYRSAIPEDSGLAAQEAASRDGLTLRAFLIAIALCVFIGVAFPYNRMVIRGGFINLYFMDRATIFLFFLLTLVYNPIVGLVRRGYALTRGELLSIYVMFLFLLPASRIAKSVITYSTGATYHTSPERRSLEVVVPHIVPWLSPHDAGVVQGLYEGIPQEASIPWQAWIVPLVSWGAFLMVLFGVLLCLAVIMRKQWVENERFDFPIMQVPLGMAEQDGGRLGPLFRNRLMWAGFGIVFLIGSINALHNHFYTFPQITLGTTMYIFRRSVPLTLKLHFAIFAYSYFVNLDVSLSLWVFNVVSKIARGVVAILGMEQADVSGTVGPYSSRGSAFLAFMGMGYLIALTAYSLYVARGHLLSVLARAMGKRSGADDSGEVLTYRTAVIGTGLGLLYLGGWLWRAGVSPSLVVFLLASCFMAFFVLARIVSETGFVTTYSPLNPAEFVMCSVGSSTFSPQGLVTLGFGYIWTMTRLNDVMGRGLAALRLAGEFARKRGVVWAVVAALAIGLISATGATLKLGYSRGGLNLDQAFYSMGPRHFEGYIGPRLLDPRPVFTQGFAYSAVGIGIAAILMALRMRYVWWPFHPVALPLATIWFADTYFIGIFLAWGIKVLVLKFGGSKVYRASRPFFIGIILGEVVCTGMWIIIDFITGMGGHLRMIYGYE